MEKIYYSCEDFQRDVLVLKDKLNSLNNISVIIPIARGGLTFSHKLGEVLNIRNISSINAISYNGDKKLNNIKVFGEPNLLNLKTALIVDDISDSGRTLKTVVTFLKAKYPDINIFTATIFINPKTEFIPDFYLHKTEKWINFFWESF
jgi:hypoxanthine phosphoribosyltransferase